VRVAVTPRRYLPRANSSTSGPKPTIFYTRGRPAPVGTMCVVGEFLNSSNHSSSDYPWLSLRVFTLGEGSRTPGRLAVCRG
jgi:hypothetical protein